MAYKPDIDRLVIGETLHLPPSTLYSGLALSGMVWVSAVIVAWAVYLWVFA